MSRNFELLQQAIKYQVYPSAEENRTPVIKTHAPPNAVLPDKRIDKEIRRLVHRLFCCGDEHLPRVVVFSNIDRVDKSDWIWRAGEILAAQKQGTVCLLDANLALPSAHSYFGIDNGHGFINALFEPASLIKFAYRMADTDITVIPSGASTTREWPGRLSSGSMHLCIQALRAQFDFVLISAPPIMTDSATAIIGQWADGIVLVAEADCTQPETALKAKRDLERANVRVLGAVMNNRKFPVPNWLSSRLQPVTRE